MGCSLQAVNFLREKAVGDIVCTRHQYPHLDPQRRLSHFSEHGLEKTLSFFHESEALETLTVPILAMHIHPNLHPLWAFFTSHTGDLGEGIHWLVCFVLFETSLTLYLEPTL